MGGAPASKIIEEFGFPVFYTAFLNPQGEYQVGNKIYWYGFGFKHEATSDKELSNIKQNPSTSPKKYSVTSRLVRKEAMLNTKSRQNSNLTTQDNTTGWITKYIRRWDYYGGTSSPRRFTFSTRVFSDEFPRTDNDNTQNWRTYLHLETDYEYYSFGRRKWYPTDNTFYIYYNLQYTAQAYVNNASSQTLTFSDSINNYLGQTTTSFAGSTHTIALPGAVFLSNDAVFSTASASDVKWTYEIDGQLTVRDEASPNVDGSNFTIYGGPDAVGPAALPHLW